MAQDPKIIYKTNDPKVQKILNNDKAVNMTPGVSEVQAKIERDKMLNQQKGIVNNQLKINDSTSTKPVVKKPNMGILQKIKNFLNN